MTLVVTISLVSVQNAMHQGLVIISHHTHCCTTLWHLQCQQDND